MQLTDHFSLEEMVFSQTATRKGIDNTPDASIIAELVKTCVLLEDCRKAIGNLPIKVTSGYRSEKLNQAIGGSTQPLSAHVFGRASDIIAPRFERGSAYLLAERIIVSDLPFDKLILEFGRWVHIQTPKAGSTPRKLIYTAVKENGRTVYKQGLTA